MATLANLARRILVVDDEALVCDSIRRVLALGKHEVEIATSGQDALAAFKPGKFDLIILDYEMPGMKGDKVAAAMKVLAPEQPILLITGYGEQLRLAGNFPLAVNLVITKPFDMEELQEAVRQLTERAGAPRCSD